MIVTDEGAEVIVSPTGAKVLARLAAGERVSPMDPHPAARDRLISTGLIRTNVAGPDEAPPVEPRNETLAGIGRSWLGAIEDRRR